MIDSVKFMLTSQLNLADNLAEGLHRGKWIDSLWLFKCKDWKKVMKKGLTKVKPIYLKVDTDFMIKILTDFVLMRKGVYAYGYMDSWIITR